MPLFRGASSSYGRFLQTQTDSPPAGVYDIKDDTNGINASTGLMSGNTGVGAAVKIFQITPTGSGISAVVATGLQMANNKGWQVPTSYMQATSSQQRFIAGSINVTFENLYIYNASSSLGASCQFYATIYRRSAAGALTYLTTLGNGFSIPALSSNVVVGNVSAGTGTSHSEWVFSTGETIYFELYVQIPGATTSANSCMAAINSTTNFASGCTFMTGIGVRFLQSLSAGVSVAGSVVRNIGAKRSAGIAVAAAKQVAVGSFRSAGVAVAGAVTKAIALIPKQAGVAAAGALQRRIAPSPIQAGVAVASTQQVKVAVRRTAGVAVAGAVTRTVGKFAAAGVAIAGGFDRFLTLHRNFTAGVAASARAVIGLPQTVLNRLGGGAVIKRVITYIFDD